MSSAKVHEELRICSDKLLIYTIKKIGPRTLLCGTPLNTWERPADTNLSPIIQKLLIQDSKFPSMPYALSLEINLVASYVGPYQMPSENQGTKYQLVFFHLNTVSTHSSFSAAVASIGGVLHL